MPTAYPYATGKDPTYDAWKAQADYRRVGAQTDAEFARKQAEQNYQLALSQLAEQGTRGARNIDTSMLGRGVYRSGETNRRQAELSAEVLKGRENAGVTYQSAVGKVDSDLQRALTALDLEAEQQVQAAMSRGAGGGRGGAGGGGGGSVTGVTVGGNQPDWLGQLIGQLYQSTPTPMFGAGQGRGRGSWGAGTSPGGYGPQPVRRGGGKPMVTR